MIPLHGFLEGDTMGLVILAMPDDTMQALADRLCVSGALRAEPPPEPRVVFGGSTLEPTATVADVGFRPLDRFDVIWRRD